MKKTLASTILGIAFASTAHAGMITLDPSVFDAGTDVTNAYDSASLYTAYVTGNGQIVREAAYVQICSDCKPAVQGTAVFSPRAESKNPFFYAAADFSNDVVKQKSGGFGDVLLVEFDEPTDYVRVIGSGAQHQNQFMMDYWDADGNLLGRCAASPNPECQYSLLGTDYFDDQRLYALRLPDPKIKFVTMGGYYASGYVSSVSFVKVPEPAPLITLAGSMLILAGLRPRRNRNYV